MTDAATMTWSAVWSGAKARVAMATPDCATAFVDVCDPVPAEARKRMLARIVERFPAVDVQPIEARLLEMAAKGPPQETDDSPAVVPQNPAPCEDQVNGADLLDEIADTLRRHVVLPEHADVACSLWIVHSYISDRFTYSPRLLVSSPDKRCGKSLLLRFVGAMSARPLTCENISAAALYRSVEKFSPTLILDEADTFLAGQNVNEDLRGVVNAGFASGGCVLRCVGDDSEPMPFRVFGPLALGMIGRPPGTIEDRSIVVSMRRKLAGESVAKLPPGRPVRDLLVGTLRRIVRWCDDSGDELAAASPHVPAELDDRAGDCWFALLAIADVAGGTWPSRARAAAVALSAGRDAVDSFGLMLLEDLRRIFAEQSADRLKTSTIVLLLAARTDRPWPDYRRGRAITERQVGRLLEPFGVKSSQFRVPTETNAVRGYCAADLDDAWGRYLPASPSDQVSRVTPVTASRSNGLGSVSPVTPESSVTGPSVTHESSVTGGIALQPAPLVDCHGCHGAEAVVGRNALAASAPTPMDDLDAIVDEMAADVEAMRAGTVPFRGEALREHYRAMVRRQGVAPALADAQHRYQQQVIGNLLPLAEASNGAHHA